MPTAGLVPIMRLASAGLPSLADVHLSVTGDKGADPGRKISSLVAGMVAGALREFTFSHVRQLNAIASRLLNSLAARANILPLSGDDDGVLSQPHLFGCGRLHFW